MRFPAAVVFALWAGAARAGDPGAEGFLFARLAADARGAALGGAADALGEGFAAPTANPAGLVLGKERAVADTVVVRPLGFVGDAVGAVFPAGEGGLAGTVSFLERDALPVTTEEFPDGTGGLAAVLGAEAELTGAQWLNDRQAFGVSLRLLHEQLGDLRIEALAADAGLVRAVTPDWTVGVAARGLGRIIASSATRDPFPLSILGGARYEFPDWPARAFATADLAPSGPWGLATGVEAGELFGCSARASLAMRQASAARLGVGLGFHGGLWTFDYAFAPDPVLGAAHLLSIRLRLGTPS